MKRLIIKTENVNYFLMIIVFFLFVFGIQLNLLPINTSKMVFLYLILYFILKNKRVIVPKELVLMISWLLILMLLSFIRTFTSLITYDYAVPYAYFIFIFEAVIGSYLLVILIDSLDYSFEKFIEIFIYICFIQSLIIILMFINPVIRDFLFSIVKNVNIGLFERMGGFRAFGLAGSVTYDLSVFLSIGIMLISYKIINSTNYKLIYLFFYLTIFMAIILSARSGFIGVALSALYILVNIKYWKDIRKIAFITIKIILMIIIVLFLIMNFLSYETLEIIFLKLAPWAFEMFINLSTSGKIGTASTKRLMEMYFPLSEKTLLIGDGYWRSIAETDRYYMHTDAGYMRHTLFYGLPISLLLYCFYIIFFYYNSKIAQYLGNKKFSILIYFLAFYYFLLHAKGDFLLGSGMNIKLFCLLTTYFIYKKYKFENKPFSNE